MFNKEQKVKLVEQMRQDLLDSEFVVVTKNHGLTVSQATELRKKISGCNDSHYKVAKNTLLRLSAKGTNLELLCDYFIGPTAVAYGKSPVEIAKVLVEFIKSNEKLTIMSGLMNGKILSDSEIRELSSLPSLPELLVQVTHYIQSAAMSFVQVLELPAIHLCQVLEALSKEES